MSDVVLPRASQLAAGALLIDAGNGVFCAEIQQRILSMAEYLSGKASQWSLSEVVAGMNNILLVFDPQKVHPLTFRDYLIELWPTVQPEARAHRVIEVSVVYGAGQDSDLPRFAEETGLSVERLVRLHSEPDYCVACLGGMPGFIYLSGLPDELALPRRAIPSPGLERGSIIVGGAQAGIMPITAPSGWHSLGHTDTITFDAASDTPCLFRPGDLVRFKVLGVQT